MKGILLLPIIGAMLLAGQKDPSRYDKKNDLEKGYHHAAPKNTGPTPESAKDDKKPAKKRNESELGDQMPPTRTPQIDLPAKQE